jgi:hypothetical protein
MTPIHRVSNLIGIGSCLLTFSALGQDAPEPPDAPRLHWGVSAGLNRYQEKGLMQLQGPEMGVHATLTSPSVQWESDVLLGKQHYTSQDSGSMTGITNLETRWRALVDLGGDTQPPSGVWAGLAFHTLWNDLRGTTTFNQITYGGYERSAVQLWLPVRWSGLGGWDVDAGLLIYGRHTSKLSQVNSHYSDIVNTQHSGQYAQASFHWAWDDGNRLTPFVRYTRLGKSSSVVMNGNSWIEPASDRWQIGAVWAFNSR